MAKSYKIFLRRFHLQAVIGVLAEERRASQPLVAEIELTTQVAENFADDIAEVPCYKSLSDDITALAQKLQPQLLETLAREIAALCLRDERVSVATVRLEKPEALGGTAIPAVEITQEKGK